MVRAELGGESAPDLLVAHTTIELGTGRYAVRFEGRVVDAGTVESVDASALTLRGDAGPNAGRTIRCRYQVRGDRLRVCFGLDGVLPTEFVTAAGDQRYLAVYRRTGLM